MTKSAKMFFGVGVPMTRLAKMYDTPGIHSPENCAHGVVCRLNFMSKALSYSEYKAEGKMAF